MRMNDSPVVFVHELFMLPDRTMDTNKKLTCHHEEAEKTQKVLREQRKS
jgi:hypothetical protein